MIDEKQISELVRSVLEGKIGSEQPAAQKAVIEEKTVSRAQTSGRKQLGVFETMEEALDACNKAYTLFRNYNKEQRENIITEIRKLTHAEAEIMGKLGVEDTKMGNAYHKTLKHHLVADKTPGTEDLTTTAWSGDRGLTLIEQAPYGIIGAITPSTNPSETVICNSIGMLAAGNGVVFNPHPHAKII